MSNVFTKTFEQRDCFEAGSSDVFGIILQLNAFRKLRSHEETELLAEDKLYNNFRPTQPLNNRKVFSNFDARAAAALGTKTIAQFPSLLIAVFVTKTLCSALLA